MIKEQIREKATELLGVCDAERRERAKALKNKVFLVESNEERAVWEVDGKYLTTYFSSSNEFHCNCPDHTYRKLPCKHILAVCLVVSEKNKNAVVQTVLTKKATELGYFPRMIDGKFDIDILDSLLKTRYPVLLVGPRGTGKDFLIEVYGRVTGKEVVIIPLRGEIDEATLYGRYEVSEGKFRFEYGVIPRALHSGSILVLDEINACPPDKLFSLHHLLARFTQGDTELLIPEFNRRFKVHPEARIVATMNENYAGINELNQALNDRFLKFFLDYDETIDTRILRKFGFTNTNKVIESITEIRSLRRNGEIITDWSHRMTERLAILVKSDLPTEFIANSISLEFFPEERFTIRNILNVIIEELRKSLVPNSNKKEE